MDAAAMRERSLVLRAQSGDRAAFDELLRSVDGALLRYIRSITGDRTSAEDVLQDVLVAIVRKVVWLREPSLFRPWAFRIASRAAFRAIRSSMRTESFDAEPSVEFEPPDPVLRARLGSAVQRLTEATRAVIHLHYFEELSLADVAAALEISPGTVKSRLAYGLARLRKELS
jgi:RNA polymerase sigma-70 factor, ECF subfamily